MWITSVGPLASGQIQPMGITGGRVEGGGKVGALIPPGVLLQAGCIHK